MNRNNKQSEDDDGLKRKAVSADSADPSSNATAVVLQFTITESDLPPKKKQVTAPPPAAISHTNVASAAPVKEDISTSDLYYTRKPEETTLSCISVPESDMSTEELILSWETYDEEENETEHSVSLDTVVSQGLSFRETTAVKINQKSEWDERYYTLKLIDKKEKDNEKLAKLNFVWWEDSSEANLMNFNQKSNVRATCNHAVAAIRFVKVPHN
jgi:hypothetical protein